eukprot:CAMPEP_0203916048 /NCGR_PEP_ID=MMETSP0359-20131031/56752_1 /ASSEMBLY_ACC=CAM_ASM_000338 /TAXON_ID=268821 /ORGANISM="Scrippsiella Hangoei, Strain SHTV-5" /LENGTH=90 /DNA_ID=CAMNT_0050842659 /DNA_START=422 /DNA_END=694 /DNA_ORIENTATION=-
MSGSSAAGAAPPCSSTSPRPFDEGHSASFATSGDDGMCSESSYLLSSSSTISLDLLNVLSRLCASDSTDRQLSMLARLWSETEPVVALET